MKKFSFFQVVCLTAFFSLPIISCSPGLEELKRREEGARTLAEAHIGEGDYSRALKKLLEAKEIYDEDPFLHYDLGLVYMALEQIDSAIESLETCIELDPDYSDAWNSLGTAFYIKKDYDRAITHFKKAGSDLVYGTPEKPISNMGWAYLQKRNYKLAEECFKRALKRAPGFPNACRGLGNVYMKTGKVEEAVDIFEKGIENAPKFAALYLDLGRAYRIDLKEKKARFAFEKAIEFAPLNNAIRDEAKKELER